MKYLILALALFAVPPQHEDRMVKTVTAAQKFVLSFYTADEKGIRRFVRYHCQQPWSKNVTDMIVNHSKALKAASVKNIRAEVYGRQIHIKARYIRNGAKLHSWTVFTLDSSGKVNIISPPLDLDGWGGI